VLIRIPQQPLLGTLDQQEVGGRTPGIPNGYPDALVRDRRTAAQETAMTQAKAWAISVAIILLGAASATTAVEPQDDR
jgi:hypothetical protein